MRAIFKAVLLLVIDAATGADSTLGTSMKNAVESSWLTYRVPMEKGHAPRCCDGFQNGKSTGCPLEGPMVFFGDWHEAKGADKTASDENVFVFLKVNAAHGIDRVRVFSESCEIALGDARVQQVDNVSIEASLAALGPLVDEHGAGLEAIALHRGDNATAVLQTVLERHQSERARVKAASWLAKVKGTAGFEAVIKKLAAETSSDARRRMVSGLTQSDAPARDAKLKEIASKDTDERVRSAALYALAEADGAGAAESIEKAARTDKSPEVQRKAIYALSSLPAAKGLPVLERIATDGSLPKDLRKKALSVLANMKGDASFGVFDRIFAGVR
jgi:hypothetical protein